jgi:acyl-coenzyme A synthetase/AMP-(fatty) acid ligase
LPASTTQRLITDLSPKILLTSTAFKATAHQMRQECGVRVVTLDAVCTMESGSLPLAPIDTAAAAALKAAVHSLDAKCTAAVFFTGGTTGTPKAVPHSHDGLLWFARTCLRAFPAPFARDVPHAGTVCFTPFFHVMGYCANMVFNLHAGVRAAILEGDATLSPSLLLAACRELRPSCVNTVPWVVEAWVETLRTGAPAEVADVARVLSALHLLTYGGAALAPHCPPILRRHGIVVACTYGQTELAGPIMFGKPNGDPNALLPLPGVEYELVRGEVDGEGEGELVLLGNGSSTSGYLALGAQTKKQRSLTGGDASCTTVDRFHTNDRFRAVRTANDDAEWLLYLCRADDLLVHTSGEMSNPLPTEQRLMAECSALLHAVAVMGTNRPRCMALLELRASVDPTDESVMQQLRAALAKANGEQPQYSAVLDRHALLVPEGTLPLTVKGTVQRSKAEGMLQAELDAVTAREPGANPTLDTGDAGGALTYDSLAVTTNAPASTAGGASMSHPSGLSTWFTLWILVTHTGCGNNFSEMASSQGINYFLVLAGFSAQLNSLEPRDALSWPHLRRFYIGRTGRLILSTWMGITLDFKPACFPNSLNGVLATVLLSLAIYLLSSPLPGPLAAMQAAVDPRGTAGGGKLLANTTVAIMLASAFALLLPLLRAVPQFLICVVTFGFSDHYLAWTVVRPHAVETPPMSLRLHSAHCPALCPAPIARLAPPSPPAQSSHPVAAAASSARALRPCPSSVRAVYHSAQPATTTSSRSSCSSTCSFRRSESSSHGSVCQRLRWSWSASGCSCGRSTLRTSNIISSLGPLLWMTSPTARRIGWWLGC